MRQVLVYDGDCGFCTRSARFIERRIPVDAEIVTLQDADHSALGTSREHAEYELLWVDRDGGVYGGAQAVAKLLLAAGGMWWPLGAPMRVPPFRWAAHWIYRLIARYRYRLPGGTPACALPPAQRPGADG